MDQEQSGVEVERSAFVWSDGGGEHPANVLNYLARRSRPNAHIIVFANEKGGVGKSTLAFHTAIALANSGAQVLAIDLDRRQRSLATAIENREATARALGSGLACPRSVVLEQPTGAMLLQEIARLGSDCRFVVIDAPGYNSPEVQWAVALANTLVTPVNPSFFDLDPLARIDAARMKPMRLGRFGSLVAALRAEASERNERFADWVLVKNRVRSTERRLQPRIDNILNEISATLDARIATGLTERVAYRELLLFGLTHPDLKGIPELSSFRCRKGEAMQRFLAELRLPLERLGASRRAGQREAATPPSLQRYYNSLRAHVGLEGQEA